MKAAFTGNVKFSLSMAVLVLMLVVNVMPAVAVSTPSRSNSITNLQTASTLTFTAEADAYVDQSTPTTNTGTSDFLEVVSSTNSSRESYIRFTVSGVSGSIQSAHLRVFSITDGTNDGPAVYRTSNTWAETGVTWDNRPAPTSGVTANSGSVPKDTWVEYDVTSLVTGNATYSFALTGDSHNNVQFSSREGSNPPQLVLTFNAAVNSPTATRTSISTPTATRTSVSSPTVTQPSTSTSITFLPIDDATIVSGSSSTNYGSATTLLVDNSPLQHFLLKFNVTGTNGQQVTSAKLRIYVVDPSPNGGEFYRVSDSSWQEETVTWNNAPIADTALLASLGSVSSGNWYEVNLTSLITGDGTYSLRVTSTSSDGTDYSSKEGSNPPQLIVTLGSGSAATSTPLPTATRTAAATSTPLPTFTRTPAGTQTSTSVPPPSSTPPSGSVVVVAVGDIHGEGSDSQSVANLNMVNSINPAAILGLGDYQYTTGDCSNFTTSGRYDTDWGSQNYRMYPAFGPTHDYAGTSTGSRADQYFSGDCAGQRNPQSAAASLLGGTIGPMQPYSFDVGSWHIVSLPSLCYRYSCDANAITTWLTNDLNAHTNKCTIAYFHEPYWTSTTTGHPPFLSTKPWVQVLYDHKVELLLSGHNHDYERFYPQNMSNVRDDANGITAFVVGTGGIGFYTFTNTAPNSAVRSDSTYGVLKLTLGSGTYTWQFVPTSGGTFTDTGSATCH